MKLTYDREADAVYLRLGEARITDSATVAPGVVLDYDEHNNIVGMEMLGVSKRVTDLDTQRMLIETLPFRAAEPLAAREIPPPYDGKPL